MENNTENKNTNAVDKIIAELSFKDFRAANPLLKNGKPKYKTHHPYSLSEETLEALETKHAYQRNEISEEEYKAFCLRYNLTHIEEKGE